MPDVRETLATPALAELAAVASMKLRELRAFVDTRVTALTRFGVVQGTVVDVTVNDSGQHLHYRIDVTPHNSHLPPRAYENGTVRVDAEGVTWNRGWGAEAADALVVGKALATDVLLDVGEHEYEISGRIVGATSVESFTLQPNAASKRR